MMNMMNKLISTVGLEDLTAVALKSPVFGAVTPCSSEKARCFGGIYLLHLQVLKLRCVLV
jgi:hypothetical protein